jgi:hypothetical protein
MTSTASAAAPVSINTGSPCGLSGAATNEGRLSTLRSGRKGRPELEGALCLWLAVCRERRAGFASAPCPVAADAATAAGLSIAPVGALAVLPVDGAVVDPTEDCELVAGAIVPLGEPAPVDGGAVVLLGEPAPVDGGVVVDPPVDSRDPLEGTGSGEGDVGADCGDGAEVSCEEPLRCGSGVGWTVASAVTGRLSRATHARTIHCALRPHPTGLTLRN